MFWGSSPTSSPGVWKPRVKMYQAETWNNFWGMLAGGDPLLASFAGSKVAVDFCCGFKKTSCMRPTTTMGTHVSFILGGYTLPPTIMEVENGSLQYEFPFI